MATLSTSYNVESAVRCTLKATISPTATTGIQLNYALTVTSGVLRFDPDTPREEFISFGGASVSSGVTTLSDVVRNLSRTANDFSGTGTGYQHSGGACVVELTNYHALYNLKANTDRVNTFSASQTISGVNKLFLNDSASWIYDDGTDIKFKSSAQAEVALATLANLSGVNDKFKITNADTTEGYANTKLLGGDGILATVGNPAGNETYTFDIDLASNSGLEISGGQLQVNTMTDGQIITGASGIQFIPARLFTLGENLTAGQPVVIKGDGMAYAAESDVLTETFNIMGFARESGSAAESKLIDLMNNVSTIAPTAVTGGKLWTGISQATSTTDIDVYGVIRAGQSFAPTTGQSRIDQVTLTLTKTGSPTGNYSLSVYAVDGSGHPTGAALATSTIAASSLATGSNIFTGFALAVTPGTSYAFSFYHATAGGDASNNLAWNYQAATNPYSGGIRLSSADSGTSWTNQSTDDHRFIIEYYSFAGTELFLSDTAGGLTPTPGTYFQRMALGLSDTLGLMRPGEPSIYATYSFTGSATTVDTELEIGFRPKAIFAHVYWLRSTSTASRAVSMGMWHHGMGVGAATGVCNYMQLTGSSGSANSSVGASAEVSSNLAACVLAPSTFTNVGQTINVQAVSAKSVTLRRADGSEATDFDGTNVVKLIII